MEDHITKLYGQIDVHKQKIENNDSVIRKNNHRGEKAVRHLQDRLESALKAGADKATSNMRLAATIAVAMLGLFQWQQNSTRSLIDKNEERIATLIATNAKLEGELNGLKKFTETEIEDRKVYSRDNASEITQIRRDLSNHVADASSHKH